MSILFYSGTKKGLGDRIQKIIELSAGKRHIERFRAFQDLAVRLRRPLLHVEMCVLLLPTKAELENALGLQRLLNGLRMVLVLPDDRKETISKSHRLFPRFITYMDGNISDLAEVIQNMLKVKTPLLLREEPRIKKRGVGGKGEPVTPPRRGMYRKTGTGFQEPDSEFDVWRGQNKKRRIS